MPPKKKSGKKKSAKSAPTRADNPLPDPISDTTKEFYLVQIRDLGQRLARYQRKCDELEVGNGEYNKGFDQLVTDKKEIVAFWKRQVEQRTDEIADLNDRLVGLQQAKDSEKEVYEGQLQQLRGEFQETRDQLTSENMILGGKLASLEEFKVQKEDLMAKFASMEMLLKQNEDSHNETIYGLERKAVIDKDRLKKDMVLRVNQVAAEFRKVSNKQMAETTKRTIRENVSINSQLAKMSDKTVEIIEENDNLRIRDKTQRRQIELLEANEKELAKKNYSNQKIIRMLTDKCRQQEAIINELDEAKKESYTLADEAEELKADLDHAREKSDEYKGDLQKLDSEIQSMSTSLEKERKDRLKIEGILKETSDAIKLALQMEDTDELGRKIEARDAMLENILVLMNSAASLGVGVDPASLGMEANLKRPKYARLPGSGKGIRHGEMQRSPIASSVAHISHYQLGDLGLIPRPRQNIPTTVEKMRMLSSTSRLGSLRRVLTKSTACQTTSVPKAMFYADQLMSSVDSVRRESLVLNSIQTPHKKSTNVM